MLQLLMKLILYGCSKLKTVYIDSETILNRVKSGYNFFGNQVAYIYIKEDIYDNSLSTIEINSGNSYVFNSIKDGYAEYVIYDNNGLELSASE